MDDLNCALKNPPPPSLLEEAEKGDEREPAFESRRLSRLWEDARVMRSLGLIALHSAHVPSSMSGQSLAIRWESDVHRSARFVIISVGMRLNLLYM
jgi:hypothetical protein